MRIGMWAKAFFATLLGVVLAGSVLPCKHVHAAPLEATAWEDALPVHERPLTPEEFKPISLPGIGDRQNTWAWSIKWYKNKLFVGTNRAWLCLENISYVRNPITALFYNYPPKDPDVECTVDPADLPLQAEIWTWTPEENLWERVYQSDLVEIPDRPGRSTGWDVGYRDMMIYREPDGTEALYVLGVTPNSAFGHLPPPRILRTADGRHFEALPAEPGTFLGDLNQDNYHASFRAPSVYRDRLYLETGTVQGNGELIESAAPYEGNDSFRLALSPEVRVYTTTVFNDYLYLGIQDTQKGFQIVKTLAEGDPPYEVIPVVQDGGYSEYVPLTTSATPLYMYVHDERIFVGTDKPAELIRINPDDTWDLVVGKPRLSPDGWKHPISGYNRGFNSTMNHHIWRMGTHQGWLYIGTMDASTSIWKETPFGPLLEPYMGFDLFATRDGYYMYLLTRTGFDNKFTFGIRGFESTPYGLFFGTSNNWYGTVVWWGNYDDSGSSRARLSTERNPIVSAAATRPPPLLELPDRLEAEQVDREILLSWEAPRGDFKAQVYRRNVHSPTDSFQEIANTSQDFLFTNAPPPDLAYAYQVKLVDPSGRVSPASNVVQVPNATPPITCRDLLERFEGLCDEDVDFLERHGARILPLLEAFSNDISQEALYGDVFSNLLQACQSLERDTKAITPKGRDLSVLLYKFLRRVELARSGLLPPTRLLASE